MALSAPITELLLAWRGGERGALDELLPFALSEDTVSRNWRLAKGCLLRELTRGHAG